MLSAYAYKIQRKASFITILFIKRIRLINNMRLINDHNAWSFAAMDSLHWDSVIRGHHVYKDIWTPFIGEVLRVEQETHNVQDRFAVAVVKDDITVGHVPCEVSCLVWHFIEHDGTVNCEVTGRRKHGIGLEVPCTYIFSTKKKIIRKLRNNLPVHKNC